MQNIILAGNAITANILYKYIDIDTRYKIIGFTVDDDYVTTQAPNNLPCIGLSNIKENFNPQDVKIIMAIGYTKLNTIREKIYLKLKSLGYTIETYVHPNATILTTYPIGEGSVIMAGSLIEPDAKVGSNCFLWGNTVIAHNAIVNDNCWIAAGAVISGMAKIGSNSFIGVNATISNKVEVGSFNIIGGSAFISKNTKNNAVYLARSAELFRCSATEYDEYFGI